MSTFTEADANGNVHPGSVIAATARMAGSICFDRPSSISTAVDQKYQPRQTFLETRRLLEPEFRAVTGRAGTFDQEAARASAVAAGMLVSRCTKVLEANEAFRIAVYGFIEGARTAADPVHLR